MSIKVIRPKVLIAFTQAFLITAMQIHDLENGLNVIASCRQDLKEHPEVKFVIKIHQDRAIKLRNSLVGESRRLDENKIKTFKCAK
jgi:hypothetical protein